MRVSARAATATLFIGIREPAACTAAAAAPDRDDDIGCACGSGFSNRCAGGVGARYRYKRRAAISEGASAEAHYAKPFDSAAYQKVVAER